MNRKPVTSLYGPPGRVPAEVLAACAMAAECCEQLALEGLHVAFSPTAGRVRVALEDESGRLVRPLRPSEALALVTA